MESFKTFSFKKDINLKILGPHEFIVDTVVFLRGGKGADRAKDVIVGRW